MEQISAVILTFNEERNITRCIESVRPVADEILVVDSFSTDETPRICQALGVRFHQHVFEGYIEQKNYATALASHDLILSLDADEALSPELQQSVRRVKAERLKSGYRMNRMTNYCGKWIRHSGWYPDIKMRLVDRRKGRWGGRNPHDRFEMQAEAKSEWIPGDILHYSYYTIGEHKMQAERFAQIAASAMYRQGERSSVLKLIYKPLARFVKSYFIKMGFLDGQAGWIIARMTAWSSFLRYRNLLHLERGT